MSKHILVSAMFLVVLAMVPGAHSQAPREPLPADTLGDLPTDSIGVHASQLMGDIRRDIERADRYVTQLRTASAEDSVVIRSQLFDTQRAMLLGIHALGNDLVQMEKEGPQPELRSDVLVIFDRTTPRVWAYLSMLRAELDRQRARRTSTAAAERPRLEDRIARMTGRLDTAFQLAYEHLGARASLGIATHADSTALHDEVDERSDEVIGRMTIASERIGDLIALQREAPNDNDVKMLLVAQKKSLKTESSSLTALLPIMDGLGIPTTKEREQLVLITRDISRGLVDVNVARQLASRTWTQIRAWARGNGPSIIVKLLLIVGIMVLARILARLVRRAVGKALDRKAGISVLVRRMAVQTSGAVVMLLGLVVALGQLGISLGPLVAGLGVAGFIVGFALQNTLSNFAAGMMILMYRPYDVGDVVEITGAFGKVERMSLVSTNIVTFDNQMIVVPNSKIWGDVIKNVTHQTMRRVDMVFGISYADDIPKAERVLGAIIKAHAKVLADPAPIIKLNKLNDSSVDFIVRPWVMRDDYWDVYWDVTREVKMRFDAEGISIPFPQRDVHVYQEK